VPYGRKKHTFRRPMQQLLIISLFSRMLRKLNARIRLGFQDVHLTGLRIEEESIKKCFQFSLRPPCSIP
jgi:hypothetical protein